MTPAKKTFLSLFLPLMGIAILFLAVNYLEKNNINFFSKAYSNFANVEPEVGSLTNGASIVNDSNASGGKYVKLTNTVVNTNFQPTAPYYSTFYYQWYKAPGTDGGWSYWTDHGNNPPNTWFSYYLPDPKPGVFDPANELYSANDYNNFKWQMAKMAEAKIEVSIASWFGPGTKEDIAFDNIINDFMHRSDNPYPNLRWAMYYEDEGFSDPTVATIVADLNHISTKFVNSPYMLKINGKPVVFVYGDVNDGSTMASRWKQANTQLGNKFYVVLKLYPGYESDPNQPDSWHQYAPATRYGAHAPYSAYVSPGFYLDDGVSAERLGRNATEFENAVKSMVSANVTWKLIQTWNEWGEGTSVEPGTSVRYNSSTGKEEPDPNGYPFGNLYIDILNRNLPALESGGGTQPSSTPTPTNPPTSGTDPVVVAVGDIVCGAGSTGAACKQMETSDVALAQDPDSVLVLGDVQYEEGAYSDFMNYYHPSWGRLKSVTAPVVGNHEYLTPGAAGYFDYFNGIGVQNGAAGDRSKGYYAYDLGNWRIYVLNSNCSKAGGCGVGSPQETWLRNDLASNPRQCVLAGYHHPYKTSGSRNSTAVAPLYDALYDYGAELILAGHEHNYERFAPMDVNGNVDNAKGLVEIVVGTGGRNFTAFTHVESGSLVRNDKVFGVLRLDLHPSSYTFNFLPIPGYSFTDSGTVNCH